MISLGRHISIHAFFSTRNDKTACSARIFLTLRKDRGDIGPPLEVYRKDLKIRAPEAHQIFFLLPKFGFAIFGTMRWPLGVTGGHRWPPGALWPYARPKFQSSSIFIKLDI